MRGDGMDRADDERLSAGRHRRWRGYRSPLTSRRALLVVFIAGILVIGGVVGWQIHQAQYYQGLFWQNASASLSTHPLYAANLPGIDRFWLVSNDSGRTFERASFGPNLPALDNGSSGQFMVGLVPYSFAAGEADDQIFVSGNASDDSVGLALHANAATGDMIVFAFSKAAGTWSLRRYLHGTWSTLQAPVQSDAIKRGSGWSNELTAIMRGDQYILYINATFVGVYTDAALPSGAVGLYAADGSMTCYGPGLAVYPTTMA